MKRLIICTLSTLILGSIAAPVLASEVSLNSSKQQNSTYQTQPVDLVFLAYQGYLRDQGIPSGTSFSNAVSSGEITAESLVDSGIAAGRLSPETINDKAYVSTVDFALQNLDRD